MWKCSKCGQKVEDGFEVCWACGTTIDGVENPGFLDDSDATEPAPEQREITGMPENLVTIAKCNMPTQAYAMRARLEAAGIPVALADEFTVTMDWLLSNAIGGIKVQVPEEDVARARRALELDNDSPAADPDERFRP